MKNDKESRFGRYSEAIESWEEAKPTALFFETVILVCTFLLLVGMSYKFFTAWLHTGSMPLREGIWVFILCWLLNEKFGSYRRIKNKREAWLKKNKS